MVRLRHALLGKLARASAIQKIMEVMKCEIDCNVKEEVKGTATTKVSLDC